jgi:Ca-activated chloride channel family protein
MSLEFTRPWLLGLVLLAAPALGYYFVRSLSDFPYRQRVASLIIRSVIVLILVLALAGLTLLHPTQDRFVIFLADQSSSIGAEAEKHASDFLKQVAESDHDFKAAYLPFAARPGAVSEEPMVYGAAPTILHPSVASTADDPSATATDEQPNRDASATSDASAGESIRDGTDLAAAIEAAAGFIPPGYVPHIVLLSDGVETRGDVLASAARSRAAITTVPLPARSEPEVQVAAVNTPAEVREGEPFFVEVVIQSNHDDEGLIEVFRGDHKVIGEKRALKTGENRFRFQQSIDRDRLGAFSVRVSQLREDTLVDNNSDLGLVFALGKPRVLIIESNPSLIRELTYALEDEGVQADVRPPQGMPESLADLQNYELLVLSNVPATALTSQQMSVARTYVQDLGGGLIMLGGEQSFGLGGYYKSTLEEILPVRSDFEKEKQKPSIAMALVVDKSGSMDGDKIEMAKSAASSAVELLGAKDQVAVIAFDGETFVISQMQPASNKGSIIDDISRIEAGGGTTMYPAMESAFEMLMAASAKLKHVIILTDGISSPGDFEGMAQQMASSRMTLSTVAVGDGSDVEMLEAISRIGKGRYYFTDDPSQVPQIFAKETVTASKSAIDEQPFLPQVVRATHALADIDVQSAPFLLGYVMTRPKPTCEVILATEKGDPLLAWWRYGLGMTAAFTSDAKNRWAAEWMTWPGFGKFWTQVIRQVMRKSDARGISIAVDRKGSTAHVTVDAVNDLGQFLNGAEVELAAIDPALRQQKYALRQIAPGRYATELPVQESGAYHMEVTLKQDGQVVSRQSRGMTVGYSDEMRIRPTNEKLLSDLAALTGGTYDPEASALFARNDESAQRSAPLWPYLVAIASVLLVLDVALRRIDFSLHWPLRRILAGA